MNTFFKTLAALAFLCGVQAASAACYPNSGLIPAGSPPVVLTNGMWCTQNSGGYVGGQRVVVQQAPQPFYGSSYPVGVPMGNTGQCGGLAERLGRVIGANRGNDARNTENGGFLGYIAGGFFCPMMSNQGQRVVVQQAPQQFVNPTYGGVQQQAVVQGQRPTAQLQETSFAAAGDQDTCRLRSNGTVVAEIKLPLSVKREEAKQICNEWQQREASARGLR